MLALSLLILILLLSSAALAGEDVRWNWDPYTSDPIVGFKLYMGNTPNVSVTPANLVATITGQATVTYTHVNAPVGQHYWVLTAYNATQESGKSNEVGYIVKLKPPGGLSSTTVLTFNLKDMTVTMTSKE